MEYNNSMPSEEFEKDNKEDRIEPLVAEINYKFKAASDKRQDDEDRWLQAYDNYRGKYYKNIQFTEREKSRVFVKVTKTKVLAAYGQIIDVLFGTGKFPLIIQETKVPEGIAEYAHLNPMKEKMGEDKLEGVKTSGAATKHELEGKIAELSAPDTPYWDSKHPQHDWYVNEVTRINGELYPDE